MDEQTLGVYDREAEAIAARHRAGAYERLHKALLTHFHRGEPTADIGTGSGRDLAWLVANGFLAVGYEPSAGMRRELASAYPSLVVHEAALPALETIRGAAYANVLCAAVLMHLPAESLPAALRNLARILRPGGRLALTWRTSQSGTDREADGRLFAPIESDEVAAVLAKSGIWVILCEKDDHPRQPTAAWTMVLAEKTA